MTSLSDLEKTGIERLWAFVPPDGLPYYVVYSGGGYSLTCCRVNSPFLMMMKSTNFRGFDTLPAMVKRFIGSRNDSEHVFQGGICISGASLSGGV